MCHGPGHCIQTGGLHRSRSARGVAPGCGRPALLQPVRVAVPGRARPRLVATERVRVIASERHFEPTALVAPSLRILIHPPPTLSGAALTFLPPLLALPSTATATAAAAAATTTTTTTTCRGGSRRIPECTRLRLRAAVAQAGGWARTESGLHANVHARPRPRRSVSRRGAGS